MIFKIHIPLNLVLYLTWYCILLCIVSNLVLFRVGVVLNLVLYLSLYCIQLGIALTWYCILLGIVFNLVLFRVSIVFNLILVYLSWNCSRQQPQDGLARRTEESGSNHAAKLIFDTFARTSFSMRWKWKVKAKSGSGV